MRRRTDVGALRALLAELGQLAEAPATLYLVGGATAVAYGWRSTTVDIDLYLEPESDQLLQALPALKERLSINIELASPLDFLPELPGWRDRSPFLVQEGPLTVRHFDPHAQALAKLERGFDQDLRDVDAMADRGLLDVSELERLFSAIELSLFRFPAIDATALREEVSRWVAARRAS